MNILDLITTIRDAVTASIPQIQWSSIIGEETPNKSNTELCFGIMLDDGKFYKIIVKDMSHE